MTKIDIFSGFLGAGKTTLIKKLLSEAYAGEKLVLIENEFGEIGIDGGFMQDAGIEVTEMNSGCICCSLVGDFAKALEKVLTEYHPDRILIEPSGVGKLSDIIRAVQGLNSDEVILNGFTTVADVKKCKMYMKNFGEFFNDQIENAGCIVLSHTQSVGEEKIADAVALLREHPTAVIVTTPWDALDGKQLLAAMERRDTIEEELARLAQAAKEDHHHHGHHHHHECEDPDCDCHEHEHHGHHHHHECDDPECDCHEHEHHGHHHHHECDDPECDCHEHEHHGHHHHHECDDPDCDCHEREHHGHHHHHECDDPDCDCHEHEHHGHHHHHECDDPNCSCHEHGHHHHHHADEVFVSWGVETAKRFGKQELEEILEALVEEKTYGVVLRAKGIVESTDGGWLHFDYTPGEQNIRKGGADFTGRLCVIGSKLDENGLKALFNV